MAKQRAGRRSMSARPVLATRARMTLSIASVTLGETPGVLISSSGGKVVSSPVFRQHNNYKQKDGDT